MVDDQAMVRAGFRLIVQSQSDMQVVGEAADGQEAVDLVRRERPEVVLMDIRMPKVDGIAATREIVGVTRVVILTTF
ncbi:MAG: response regulator transcription factor, partial [Chloroflexi bacterium]